MNSTLLLTTTVSILFFYILYMMFEAFGFTQERTLHCRKLSQLPSVWTTLVVLIRTSDSQLLTALLNEPTNQTDSLFHRARCWLVGSITGRRGVYILHQLLLRCHTTSTMQISFIFGNLDSKILFSTSLIHT